MENPMGNRDYAKVRLANRLVSRVAHLIWLAVQRGVYVCIEQPSESLLWEHPRIKHLLNKFGFEEVRLELGAFGASFSKRLKLMVTVPWGEELKAHRMTADDRHKMRETSRDEGLQVCVNYTDSKGTKRTSGGPDLKGTEAYPFGFGAVIGKLHRAHVDKVAGDNVCVLHRTTGSCLRTKGASPTRRRAMHASTICSRGLRAALKC